MANSTIIYACTDDGLAIFNKPGTLPEWLPPRMVLQGRHVGGAWAEPGPPIRVLVAADGGLLLSESGGRMWEEVGPQDLEGRIVSLDHDEGRHLLLAMTDDGALWVSSDGGVTWETGSDEEKRESENVADYEALLPAGTLALVEIPGAGGLATLMVGTSDGLHVSQDGGSTWSEAALPREAEVTALARDPERRDRLYAATAPGYLFESGNRGRNWDAINDEAVGSVGAMCVLRI
jgi:photosystem II stability/assembly factor-like uncharacterized protein